MLTDNEFADASEAFSSENNERSAWRVNFNYYYEFLDLPFVKAGIYSKIITVRVGKREWLDHIIYIQQVMD